MGSSPSPARPNIELNDDRVAWRLDPAKAREIIEKAKVLSCRFFFVARMHRCKAPGRKYVRPAV
jgi:hypothetical protein